MQKTLFKISKMDCPCEEQLIRMKLGEVADIHSLNFDLNKRTLTVHHSGSTDQIFQYLDSLNLNTSIIESVPFEQDLTEKNDSDFQKKLLWQVLFINFFFFLLEITTGFIAKSMGLVADSLDMLADSFVYGLALIAVGGTVLLKKRIAKTAGYFQLFLALSGFAEVIRRFAGYDSVPVFEVMIIISILALTGNIVCLFLLQKSKSSEAHMQASMIFTSNDIIVNIGVIVAGGLVYLTDSRYPDLIAGIIIFFIVSRGAFKILGLSR